MDSKTRVQDRILIAMIVGVSWSPNLIKLLQLTPGLVTGLLVGFLLTTGVVFLLPGDTSIKNWKQWSLIAVLIFGSSIIVPALIDATLAVANN